MTAMIKKIMGSARNYTIMDFGALKMMMFTCGILIGLYFALPIFKVIWLVWILFVISFGWIMYRTFIK